MERDVRLSFWQILMSPFVSIKNMVTSKADIDEDRELREDSTDKIEADLAKSSKNIDSKVDAYGNSGKAQRKEMLKSVEVSQDKLNKSVETTKKEQSKGQGEKDITR